ncbi:hypothetical protein [Streptomyces sp. NPDC093149]
MAWRHRTSPAAVPARGAPRVPVIAEGVVGLAQITQGPRELEVVAGVIE